MKKALFLFLLCICLSSSGWAQQEQDLADSPYFFKVASFIVVKEYNPIAKTFGSPKIALRPLLFTIQRRVKIAEDSAIVIKFSFIKDEATSKNEEVKKLKSSTSTVNSDDNSKMWALKKEEFEDAFKQSAIVKSFRAPHIGVDYGANVSLPFKYRPGTSGQNAKITPDVALGPYTGVRWRLSKKAPYYLTAPVVTVALTTISINDNTVTPGNTTSTSDGLILGITKSVGAVFKLGEFQIGGFVGWDKATGEIGKDWIYNNKAWYSVSIGYSFFQKSTGTK